MVSASSATTRRSLPNLASRCQQRKKSWQPLNRQTTRRGNQTTSRTHALEQAALAEGEHRVWIPSQHVGDEARRCRVVSRGHPLRTFDRKGLRVAPPHFNPMNFADPGLAAGLTLLISLALLAAWLLYFDQDSVRRMGFVYAERLFECLPSLSSSAPRKKRKNSYRLKFSMGMVTPLGWLPRDCDAGPKPPRSTC